MKKSNFSMDKLWDYNLFLIALFPVFPKGVQSILMLLFFVFSSIIFIKKKDYKIKRNVGVKVLLFSGIFILYIIGSLYSDNSIEAVNFIIRTSPLLLFPLSIGILAKGKIDSAKIKTVLKLFVISLVLALLCIHLYLYRNTIDLSNWEYRLAFEKLTDVHGTYFSLWIAFGVLILFSQLFTVKKKTIIFLSIIIIYFTYWQLVIGARLPLISTLFLVTLLLVYKIKNKRLKISVVIGIATTCIVLLFFNQKKIIEKLDFSLPKGDYHLQHTTMTSEQIRGGVYYCSFNLVQKQWFFGYGIGDVNDELNACYKKEIDTNVYQIKHYNAHNQYVQMLLSSGIIGLLIFIASIMVAIRHSYKKKLKLFLLLNLLLTICFFTENILSRHDGILFYAFFNAIFMFYSGLKKEKQ
jgi:O-antigen ligase